MACTFKPACVSVCGTWICRCLKPLIVQEHGGKQAGYHAAVCAVHKRGCHTEQPDCEKQVSLQRLVRLRCISRPSLESSKPNPSIQGTSRTCPRARTRTPPKRATPPKARRRRRTRRIRRPRARMRRRTRRIRGPRAKARLTTRLMRTRPPLQRRRRRGPRSEGWALRP